MKRSFIIAVDGPGGVGKSTVSRVIAKKLGGLYVDTGAMYRAFALALHKEGIKVDDEDALGRFCSNLNIIYRADEGGIFINGTDYSALIRTEEAGALASAVAVNSIVRRTLVAYQRTFGNDGIIVVMEGRDIGTKVYPEADIKFFLDADASVRAKRRLKEGRDGLGAKEIEEILAKRDRKDSSRRDSPLARAEDALYIDSTKIDINEVVTLLLDHIEKKLPASNRAPSE
ncbi:MAG: (d)CMP kinase [Thermodesulfobacteriota bacterium]